MLKIGEINYYTGEISLKDIVKKLDVQKMEEALNICDLTSVVKKYITWKIHLPRVKPFYAVKCNDDRNVVNTIAKLGGSFDCASKAEIKLVLDAGGKPENIIFANPCKPISHIEYAIQQNVATTTVDNEFEIYKIFKHFQEPDLVVRFRCEAKEAQCPLGDKFGCDADKDVGALMTLAKSLNLNVSGSSFHVGSGCNDIPSYDHAITSAKNVFRFGDLVGYQMNILDIGGGFPGNDDEKFEEISKIINKSLQKNFPEPHIKIIAEPGRFFVSSAYTLVCKIHAKREVRKGGKLHTNMYYLNDGVYGSFNCVLYDHQHVTVDHFLEEAENDLQKFKSLIWGPTCDALDKIEENLSLPSLSCGDLIAFPNMGAYTVPIASPFNGFMLPKTIYFMNQAFM